MCTIKTNAGKKAWISYYFYLLVFFISYWLLLLVSLIIYIFPFLLYLTFTARFFVISLCKDGGSAFKEAHDFAGFHIGCFRYFALSALWARCGAHSILYMCLNILACECTSMYINLEIVSGVHLVLAGIRVMFLIVIDPVLKRSRLKILLLLLLLLILLFLLLFFYYYY